MDQQQRQPTNEPHVYPQQVPTRPATQHVRKRRNALVSLIPVVFILLFLVGVFIVLALIPNKGTTTPTQATELRVAPEVGSLAPDFEFNDMNTGETYKLSSLRGKPVWINFWATWCPPCRAEMPDMEKIYGEYKDKDLVILGIDDGESAQTVKEFTNSLELTWPFMLDGNRAIGNKYLVSSLPSHFYVDRNGIIQAVHIGGFSTITGTRRIDPRDYLKKIIGQ